MIRKWTNDEKIKIYKLKRSKKQSWEDIAAIMGRTPDACRIQYYKYCKSIGQALPMRGNYKKINRQCSPNVRALFTEMRKQGITWDKMSRRSGIARRTLSGWAYDARQPDAGLLDAAFEVLGMELIPIYKI